MCSWCVAAGLHSAPPIAKLLDFGLARVGVSRDVAAMTALPTSPTPLTQQGAVLGTFQYMAPEQLEGRDADARSDIFAFGALIYEMVTGRRAFEGKSQASVIAAILERQPPAMSAVTSSVRIELERIVATCLAKDPDERFQTIHDVLLQLRWLALPADESRRGAPAAIPVPRPRARLRVVAGATAALLLFAVAFGTGWLLKRPGVAPAQTTRFTIEPSQNMRTIIAGVRTNFAVSPDGRLLAFVVDPGSRIYLRSLMISTAKSWTAPTARSRHSFRRTASGLDSFPARC